MNGLRDHYSTTSFPVKITSQELHSFSTSFQLNAVHAVSLKSNCSLKDLN